MPENTIYVGRPSIFGNPYASNDRDNDLIRFREWIESDPKKIAHIRQFLQGKNLACWCRLDQKCHADILLEIANS